MAKQRAYKAECNGNDFVIIFRDELTAKLNEQTIQKMCNRDQGIGADGLLLVDSQMDGYDFKIDYYNNDGSWETMCANGALCIIKLLQSKDVSFKNNLFLGKGIGFWIPVINGINIMEHIPIHNGYIYIIVCFGLLGTILLIRAVMPIINTIITGFKTEYNNRLKICFLGVTIAGLAYNLVGIIFGHKAFLIIWGVSIGCLLKLSYLDIIKSKFNNHYFLNN